MPAIQTDVYHLWVPSWQRFVLVGLLVAFSLFGVGLLFAAVSAAESDLHAVPHEFR